MFTNRSIFKLYNKPLLEDGIKNSFLFKFSKFFLFETTSILSSFMKLNLEIIK